MTTLYRTYDATEKGAQGLWAKSKEASDEAAKRREQGKTTEISKVVLPKMAKKELLLFVYAGDFSSCATSIRTVKGKVRGVKPLPSDE